MDLLLDTHVWLWSQAQPEKLGEKSRSLLEDTDNRLFVSPISSLELARLQAADRITLRPSVLQWIHTSMERLGAITLPLSHEITCAAYQLSPSFHKDPADRMLVAGALEHDLVLVTTDQRILTYLPESSGLDASS